LYIKHLVKRLVEDGYYAVVMIARRCGGLSLSTPEGFTSSRTSDIREAINTVKALPFVDDMFGIGFSLGCTILLNYVGQEGKKAPLKGAVCISPSYDFKSSPKHFGLWSKALLVNALIRWAKRHESMLSTHPKIKWDELMKAEDVRAFDMADVVGPYGYRDLDHYYNDASPIHRISNVIIPTLSISAEDDPVYNVSTIPEPNMKI